MPKSMLLNYEDIVNQTYVWKFILTRKDIEDMKLSPDDQLLLDKANDHKSDMSLKLLALTMLVWKIEQMQRNTHMSIIKIEEGDTQS